MHVSKPCQWYSINLCTYAWMIIVFLLQRSKICWENGQAARADTSELINTNINTLTVTTQPLLESSCGGRGRGRVVSCLAAKLCANYQTVVARWVSSKFVVCVCVIKIKVWYVNKALRLACTPMHANIHVHASMHAHTHTCTHTHAHTHAPAHTHTYRHTHTHTHTHTHMYVMVR